MEVTDHSQVNDARRSNKPQPVPTESDSTAKASYRILLVDDNAVNRKIAFMQLKKLGYSADSAVNGQEAIETINNAKDPYHLVLMDCQMPEMDGYEATRVIRKQETATHTHQLIVAMTANAMESDRKLCIQAGMDDYITKPVKFELLKSVLEEWLSPDVMLHANQS